MGMLDYFRRIFPTSTQRRFLGMAAGAVPIGSLYGNDIYLSDFVNNAIDRRATEISKIELRSVVQAGSSVYTQNDDISRLFRFQPNPLQTTSDFLSNVEWLRMKQRNAFIYPQYEIISVNGREFRRYLAFYPLNPISIRIGVGPDGGAWEVELRFADGSVYTLPYSELIHLKWRRGINTIIGGGDDKGGTNDYDINRTIVALDKTIQGLPRSIEASLNLKGMYTAKSLMDAEKLSKARDSFESHIFKSPMGIVATDLAGEFTPIDIKAAVIPAATLEFLKAILRERYGVSPAILSGDYSGEQHGAFYQTAIEDFIVQFEQAASACLFTAREQDVGHRVRCYYSTVSYLSTSDKLNLATLATNTGLLMLNEISAMFGMEPFEGGNRRLQSLNFVNAEKADEYQAGKANLSKTKKEDPDDESDGGKTSGAE